MSEDDDLERALGAMLRRRAESVGSAPVIDLDPAQRDRRRRHPVLIASAVAATVVAAVTLTSVLATRLGSSPAAPSETSTPATSAPATPQTRSSASPSGHTGTAPNARQCIRSAQALLETLAAHRQSVDQPMNSPLASAPGGAFIMRQQRMDSSGRYVHNEMAYFAADGHGTTMWTDPNPNLDAGQFSVAVDPNAAASKNWVVFSPRVADPGGSKQLSNEIEAWNIHTHQLRTLPHQDDAGGLGLSPFDPIVIGNIAYWIEYPTANTHRQLLIGWNLSTGHLASSQQVSDVVGLLRLGGEVALVLEVGSADVPTARIAAAPGRTIPAAVARASIGAIDAEFAVNADGTTVRWAVRTGGNPVQVLTWVIGSSTVSTTTPTTTTAARAAVPRVYAWPLVMFSDQRTVVNTSNGRVSSLPSGVYLDLVTGGDAIVTTSTSSRSNSVSRVPLAQLTTLLC